jgi:phospholipase/carboxylesterase
MLPVVYEGLPLEKAQRVLILLHGRGGRGADMFSLLPVLQLEGFAVVAPEAAAHSWYPYSFLAVPEQNEPALSDALQGLAALVTQLEQQGFKAEQLYFLGFSQGACLALEFMARHAKRYGGGVAFTGGLIGDKIYPERYAGDFAGTPIFLGTADPDFHVPVARVYATGNILRAMNAEVREQIYAGMGHTIIQDEIDRVNNFIFQASTQ